MPAIRAIAVASPIHHIVLLGLMGVGKTTVGRRLADLLDWPLSDSDVEIEAAEHLRARDVYSLGGVEALHQLEAAHLLRALARPGPLVVCAAASTIEDPRCREALRATDVLPVWLRAAPQRLGKRFESAPHRPPFAANVERSLIDQLGKRTPLFEAIDPLVIDVDERAADDTAAIVIEHLRSRR